MTNEEQILESVTAIRAALAAIQADIAYIKTVSAETDIRLNRIESDHAKIMDRFSK